MVIGANSYQLIKNFKFGKIFSLIMCLFKLYDKYSITYYIFTHIKYWKNLPILSANLPFNLGNLLTTTPILVLNLGIWH